MNAYLQLSLAQAQRALEERELTLSKRQLAEGSARLEAGVIAASDLLPLRVALAQRHQSLISAQGRVRAAQVELNALLTDAELTSQPLKASLPRAILDPERARALVCTCSRCAQEDMFALQTHLLDRRGGRQRGS